MSIYRYEAIDRQGKLVMGAMDAPDEAVVGARLSQMGYRPQKVMASGGAARSNGTSAATLNTQHSTLNPQPTGGASPKDLALFFRQFATLVRSGITLYQALDNLAPRTRQPALNRVGREMADQARNGGAVSEVMARYPRLFAPHVAAAVAAGERGGFLEIVLDEIALDYEQEIAFYKGTWLLKTLVFQGLLAVAIGQPVFPDLFPPPSHWGQFAAHVARNLVILAALCFVGWLWYRRLQLPEHREQRDALALRIPVFGNLARQKALASFCRTLYHLFHAGISPIAAWEGAMNVAPNAVIRRKLVESYDMVEKGVPIHDAFARTGLFANETEQLLATGVVSGQVVDMMERVADYYQANVERAVGSARFTMFRIAICFTIILSGALLIILAKTYFGAVLHYTDGWAD